MASSVGSAGLEEEQRYHCYQCDITVQPASSSPLTCPHCNGGFLEECLDSPPSSPELHSPWDYMGGFGQLLDDISTFLARTDVSTVNPFLLFQSQMQNLLSAHDDDFASANVAEFGHPGDHLGPGLQQLIQHLAENDPNRYGTPPASVSAIEGLLSIIISEEHLNMDTSHCAVCKDEFKLSLDVKQLPCKHLYHPECILPWLAQHNSCPVCRFELPTDDLEYEQVRTRRLGLVVSAGAQEEVRSNMLSSSNENFSREPILEIAGEESSNSSGQENTFNSGAVVLPLVYSSHESEANGVITGGVLSTMTTSMLDVVESPMHGHAESSSQGMCKDPQLGAEAEACSVISRPIVSETNSSRTSRRREDPD